MITKEIEIPAGFKIKSLKLTASKETTRDNVLSDLEKIGHQDVDKVIVELEEKKTVEKDFKWYKDFYDRTNAILKYSLPEYSIEYKLGLLRLICENINLPFSIFITLYYLQDISINYHTLIVNKNKFEEIIKICPKEFLESILKA